MLRAVPNAAQILVKQLQAEWKRKENQYAVGLSLTVCVFFAAPEVGKTVSDQDGWKVGKCFGTERIKAFASKSQLTLL